MEKHTETTPSPSPRPERKTIRARPPLPLAVTADPERSTGIDPKSRRPIDPRMPFLTPA